MQPSRIAACLAAVTLALAIAQTPAKRPLTHQDYDAWRSIQSPLLSPDGKRLAYAMFPQEGDGEVVVRELASGREWRESLGALPPPPDPDSSAPPEEETPRRGIRRAFTADSRFLIATSFPPKAEMDKARRERRRPEEMPNNGIVIFDAASSAFTRLADVRSFQVPEKAGAWLAYWKEPGPQARPAAAAGSRAPERPRRPQARTAAPLVLRQLGQPEPSERVFPNALEYSLSKDGKTLVYTVSSRQEEENGVFHVVPGDGGEPAALLAGKGKYSRLTWDREHSRLAFLSDRDEAGQRQPKFKLYLWDRQAAAAKEAVAAATPGLGAGFVVSDRGPLGFSRDGSRLFFGASPPGPPDRPEGDAEPPPAADRVVADLWHFRDDYIQPMQKVRVNQERNRTYRAVLHIAEGKVVQLGDSALQQITPSDDGRLALGTDDRPYRRMGDFDGNYADYYLVDTMAGSRRRLLDKFPAGFGGGGPRGLPGGFGGGGRVAWAPDGRHLSYFRDRHWHSLRLPEAAATNLTSRLGVAFHNEDHNTPDTPGSYGSAGWTKDGKSLLLYDRYDIWQASPDGKTTRNVTDGVGRRQRLQFRLLRLDPDEDEEEERGIDPAKPLLLRAENLETRDTGFWRGRLEGPAGNGGNTPPEKLLMGAKNFRPAGKAASADVYLVAASRFDAYPDLYWTDGEFRDLRQASDGNAQRAPFVWGKSELVGFKNADGVGLQAMLIKPENFDPARKYPLLVYIYERLSQGLHNFRDPSPGTSINPTYYASNGYLVLMPDIVYTVGWPGQSALKCVLPAIQAVVDRGFVDENAIGIQGHSWGGYQIAYMVTQTRRFRAAAAGAPVGNMTSAYNGIRWGPGRPRQFQYEAGQSRIGGSIWQYPMRFLENSPIFMADRVGTPLLILHNDQDDAVPWYQGIELFLSLRRLGKEAYLFNYNGERHGLRRRHNQKDYTARMQEFFDHYLKGAARPQWMEKGMPFLERQAGSGSAATSNGP